MISRADVEKLRSMRAPEPAVLSLYLQVPLDPAGIRGLARDLRPDGGHRHATAVGLVPTRIRPRPRCGHGADDRWREGQGRQNGLFISPSSA